MAISVSCDCGKQYKFSDDKAGKRFKCKACGELVTIPSLDADDDLWDDDYGDGGDEWGDDAEEAEVPTAARRRSSAGASRGGRSGGKGKSGSKSGGGNRTMLFVGVGVGVLVLAGIIGGVIYFMQDDSGTESVAATDDGTGGAPGSGGADAPPPPADLLGPGGAPGGPGGGPGAVGAPGGAPVAGGSFDGTWGVSTMQVGGVPQDPKGGKFEIAGNTAAFVFPDGTRTEFQAVINRQAQPPTIDLSRGGQFAGRGILQVQGNTLSMCMNYSPQGQRPTQFATVQGDGLTLFAMQRTGGASVAGGPGRPSGPPAQVLQGLIPATPLAGKLSLVDYLSDDAIGGLVLRPKQLLTSPALSKLPLDEPFQQMQAQTTIDPRQIEEAGLVYFVSDTNLNALMTSFEKAGPPPANPQQAQQWGQNLGMQVMFSGLQPAEMVLLYVRFEDGFNLQPVLDQFGTMALQFAGPNMQITQGDISGSKYLRVASGPIAGALFMPDQRTLVVTGEGILQHALSSSSGASTPLGALLGRSETQGDIVLASHGAKLRPSVDRLEKIVSSWPMPQTPGAPTAQDIAQAFTSMRQFQSFFLNLDMTGETMLQSEIELTDEQAVVAMETQLRQGLAMLLFLYNGAKGQATQNGVPPQIIAATDQMMSSINVERNASRLSVSVPAPEDFPGLVERAVLPAIMAGRKAAGNAMTQNNMKQIALAMHNYHAVHRKFPPAQPSGSQLSWRVHILPYLEEQPLYQQFKLDEPWDSPHNMQLIPMMPQVFSSPSGNPDGKTRFLSFSGAGSFMGANGVGGTGIRNITDGTSNTLMFVEAGADKAVTWTKPEDLPFDPANPLAALGQLANGVFLGALCDGSVRTFQNIDPMTLKALITIGGAELVRF